MFGLRLDQTSGSSGEQSRLLGDRLSRDCQEEKESDRERLNSSSGGKKKPSSLIMLANRLASCNPLSSGESGVLFVAKAARCRSYCHFIWHAVAATCCHCHTHLATSVMTCCSLSRVAGPCHQVASTLGHVAVSLGRKSCTWQALLDHTYN